MSAFQTTLWVATVLACGWALLRGPLVTRLAALVVIAATLLTAVLNSRLAQADVQWGIFWVDCLALAAFGALCLTTPRRWLTLMTSLQLLAVAQHLAMALQVMDPRAYVGSLYILFLGMLACLVQGTRRSRRGIEGRQPD